jgi:hypothetical protein
MKVRLGQGGNGGDVTKTDDDGRLLMELEKFNPRNVERLLRRVYYRSTTALDSQARLNATTRFTPNYLPLNQHFDRVMISNRKASLFDTTCMSKLVDQEHAFLSFLRALQKRGIVEIVTPQKMLVKQIEKEIMELLDSDEEDADIATRVSELRGQLKKLKSVTQHRLDVERSTGMNYAQVDEERRREGLPSIETGELYEFEQATTREEKLQQEQELLFLACRLGFVSATRAYGTHAGDQPNTQWVGDAMHHFYNHYIPSINKATSLAKALYSPSPVTDGISGNVYNEMSVHRQFERMAMMAAEISQGQLSLYIDEQYRGVDGVALSFAQPGDALHAMFIGPSKN